MCRNSLKSAFKIQIFYINIKIKIDTDITIYHYMKAQIIYNKLYYIYIYKHIYNNSDF